MYGLFNLTGFRDQGTTTMQIMSETMELVKLAEQGGMEMAWFAEHHFSNYCVCPSPLLMAAHCAAATTRIKLTTGILVLPLYTPARLIAEIGMVDAMSQGRLVLGVGSGYQPFEFERFDVDLETAKAQTIEILDMIEAGLTQHTFEYDGKYFKQPPTHISARGPQGVPDIWIAGDAPDLQRIAAERGYTPIFTGRMNDPNFLIEQRDRCAAAFTAAGKDADSMRFGTLRFTCVTDSKAEARDFADNALFQNRLAANLRRRQEVMGENGMMQEIPVEGEPTIDEIIDNLIIGDVETCIEKCVNEIQNIGAAHTAMFFQVGNFPHAAAMRSLERFAGEVIPGVEKIIGPLDNLPQRSAKAA